MADEHTPLETDAPVDADTDRDLAADTAVAEELSNEPPAAAADHDPAPADAPIGMATAELRAVVEALIFASPEPITPRTLYKLLANESKEAVSAAVNELRLEYLERPGLQMVEVAGGYQITTRPELHEWVRRLFHERSTQKLSVAALETLAVIAYKQPITAPEIAEVRGVNSSGGVLSTLIERKLIKTVGRKQVVGRPFMYATTREFLERFGLNDLTDVPKVEEMSDVLGFELPNA